MLRLLAIPAVLLILLALSLAWSSQPGEKTRADLTFVNRGEVTTLDPNRLSWMQDIRVGYCLFEGLYTLEPKTLNAVPGAAERADVSDDKTVYTFHLRPTARWSNGDPVTSGDFVFSWRRMLEQPGDYTYLLHYIRGAKAYQTAFAEKKSPDFSTVGIEAPDPRTLIVRLNHPVGFFFDIVAFPCCFPLHEASMKPFINEDVLRRDGKKEYDRQFTLPPNLVTNGAYKLVSWEFKRGMRMEVNPYHWNHTAVTCKSIDVVSADDYLWALTAYDTGGVDLLTDMSGELAAELLAKGRKDVHVTPAFGTYFYSFNCQPKLSDGRPNPFADVRVRRAFSMAVQKQVIVDTVTRLGEPTATHYIPPYAFDNYPSPQGLPYDVQEARRLMAEAGYPDGRGFPRLELLFNNEGQHGPIAQIVRRQWMEALGVDLQLQGIEINTFRQRLHNKDYAIARASWYGDYNDPSTFTDKYRSDSQNNDAGWVNLAFDRLCEQADVEPDAARRLAIFAEAEKLLLDEAPILPVYHYMNVYLYRPDEIRNLTMSSRNHIVMWPLRVTRP